MIRFVLFFRFVFAPRGFAAPKVALCLVAVQKPLCLLRQYAVNFRQLHRHVLMYRGFADSEFLCRRPYGGAVLQKILCQQYTSFTVFFVPCQQVHHLPSVFRLRARHREGRFVRWYKYMARTRFSCFFGGILLDR